MTPRAPHSSLSRTLLGHHRAVRRAWIARYSLATAGAVALAVAAMVAFGVALAFGEAVAWVRASALLLFIAAGLAWAVSRFRARAESFEQHLERVETSFPEVRSWLRNAIDFDTQRPVGTSDELARAVSDEAAQRLSRTPIGTLVPRLEARRPLLFLAASLAAIAALAMIWPERTQRSWSTLLQPALAAPPVRLVVEPGSVRISPGAALAVRARVWGTAARPQLVRQGERAPVATPEGESDGAKVWRFDLTQLTREQDYRVRVAMAESPWYRIALAGDPAPVSFEVEYQAPAYSRLPVQRGAGTRGDLSALRGTRAKVEVTFDRDLEDLSVRLPNGAAGRWTAVTARRWRGEMTVDREGDYQLDARAASGRGRFTYRVTPLADAPPVLVVRRPTGDVDLPAGQQIPLAILAQDDLGLSELKLQYRKDPEQPWTDLPLARFAARPREAALDTKWDASSLALLPGQTATFRLELSDDNAITGRGRTLSPTFELRFPSLADLYEKIDETQTGVQNTLEKAAEQAKELQKSLDKLARQPTRSSPEAQQSFERREEMKSALERQQEITNKIDEASQELKKSLEEASERDAFQEELARKMQEISELMKQIQSEEFREAVRRMQQALENMDRQSLEQSLPEWREQSKEMIENLQRTAELLKQLRQEEQLEALAKRAEELKKRQDELNREHQAQEQSRSQKSGSERDAEAKSLSERQQKEAEETERLARETREQAAQAKESSSQQTNEENALEQAADELSNEAAPQQQQAAEAAAQKQPSQGKSSGQRASQSLDKAAQQMRAAVEQMRQQREGLDLAALRRAAQDLVSLQREADANLESGAPMEDRANRQTDLSEGTSRVADSLATLAERTPFISPKLSESLGKAISQLQNSGREMGTGNRARGEDSGRQAGTALNEAVLELRRTEAQMCQSGGGMPKSGNAAQQLGEMGEKQSQINQETRSLAQRLSEQVRLSSGDQQQLERLAQEQQRLREQLQQMQRDEETKRQMLGRLDQAQQEMQDVEEALREGSTGGELEEKQQRILSRLLDAQRSVNRRDFDPERESRAGDDVERSSPAQLSQDLLRESDRLRLDLLKAEADRYPAQYRAFVEAYLRRLNGSKR